MMSHNITQKVSITAADPKNTLFLSLTAHTELLFCKIMKALNNQSSAATLHS